MFSIIKELFSKIKEYFYRLKNPIIFNLEEEYSDILAHREEIERRNVLVGTLRRREQFHTNLSHCFYHIPKYQLNSPSGIEYIALYQSKNLFNKDTDTNGIKYFGKVIHVSEVERAEIKEIPSQSREKYIRFDIDCWSHLPHGIMIREKSPKVYLKTSDYLLFNAKYTSELFCKSAEEYILHLGLTDLISDIYDGFDFMDVHIVKRGNRIYVKTDKKSLVYSAKDLRYNSFSAVSEISDNIKKTLDKSEIMLYNLNIN